MVPVMVYEPSAVTWEPRLIVVLDVVPAASCVARCPLRLQLLLGRRVPLCNQRLPAKGGRGRAGSAGGGGGKYA